MVYPAAGSIVLVTFPFSNLSASKLRPAIVLASANNVAMKMPNKRQIQRTRNTARLIRDVIRRFDYE